MKRVVLLTLISIFNLTSLFAQQSQKRFTVINNQKASYMGVATTIEQAIAMLDSLKSLCRNDYSMEFYGSSRNLSSKDTILEILRIEENGNRYKQGDYYMHLSNCLPFDTYRELIDSVMLGFDQGSYRNGLVPWELASTAVNILYAPLIKNQVPNDKLDEYFELYRDISIHLIKFGSNSYFCHEPEFIAKSINDEVYNTVIDRLKNHPKYPERYKQEFFEKEAEKFNPLLYDSIGIPQRIKNLKESDLQVLREWEWSEEDETYLRRRTHFPPKIKNLSKEDMQLLREWSEEYEAYWRRWNTFLTIDAFAKEKGMTLEEYFYERQIGYYQDQFGMVGYYEIPCVFSYVMKTNDQRLFDPCREFLEKHPDYKSYPDGCRKFFGLE
ncbi:hypothetical protein ACT3CD_16880 [Geofilum sp. OHC36d9]|uniref:hypothetical protein n=1 Tax=Geofilum sp. OHC36d9 TaxID=3458413 RepID=UPI004034E5D2